MPNGAVTDLMVYDGLWEFFYNYHMGNTAEDIAKLYKISRQEQDEFALMSHQRARAAIASGATADEIVPVVMPQKKGDPIVFEVDERPMDTTLEKMAKMSPAFKKDGTVTAGNASGINDAAAAVVLMSAEKAKELGLKPLAKILGYEKGGVDPAYMGLGPIPATRKLFKKLRSDDQRHRPRGAKRGLCGPGPGLHEGAGDRQGEVQPAGRRRLHRPPHRLHGRPARLQPGHAAQ